jgi:hypothetical protein
MQVKTASGEVVGKLQWNIFTDTSKGNCVGFIVAYGCTRDTLVIDVRGRDLEVVVTKPFVDATTKYLQIFLLRI